MTDLRDLHRDLIDASTVEPGTLDPSFVGGTAWALADLVPDSISDDEDVQALCKVVGPELAILAQRAWLAGPLVRIADIPESMLDAIAGNFRLHAEPAYQMATVANRRLVLAQGYGLQLRAGTKWAVNQVLTLLGLSGSAKAWWEDLAAGDPRRTYRVVIAEDVHPDNRVAVVAAIRSWLRRFGPVGGKLYRITRTPAGGGSAQMYPGTP